MSSTTRRWEPWQEEYRHGAFYIFPPAEVARVIDPLRRRYDPASAAISDAHVSLSEPLRRPPTDQQLDELRAALSTAAPFPVTFGPLTQIGPHPGVVLALSPPEPFIALRSLVHSTSLFDGQPTPRAHRPPHVTVAEFISHDEASTLLAELGPRGISGTFLCDRVTYAVPSPSFFFEPVVAIRLGGPRA